MVLEVSFLHAGDRFGVKVIRKGHFRVDLRRESTVENHTFSTLFVTVSRVIFLMLSETALNEQSDDF